MSRMAKEGMDRPVEGIDASSSPAKGWRILGFGKHGDARLVARTS